MLWKSLSTFLVSSYRKELYDDSESLNSVGCWERRKMLPAKFILDGLRGGVSRGMRSSIIKGNIYLRDMFTTHSTNSFLSEHDLIYIRQSGFRSTHSIETFNLDNGCVTGMVLIDYRKAFNMIDPTLLLKKLAEIVEWTASNKLPINEGKTKAILITAKRLPSRQWRDGFNY